MYKIFKRVMDFSFALILLILIFPLLLVIALAIKIDSRGPILFKQVRTGKLKKPFVIYKFRTMVKNADQKGPTSTVKNDVRITKLGRILRKLSLDELAQLINIVKGDMSFIGYRPGVHSNDVPDSIKYELRPGITGYAQVHGRSKLAVEKRREYEDFYTRNLSLRLDLLILFKTIGIILKMKGTN